MASLSPKAFVSYRRTDSAAASRWIARSIGTTFGQQSVFIDTDAIRTGDKWAQRIDAALREATVLIPVIGERWLSSQDKDFRRRIDAQDDWVRKEIEYAIVSGITVLPVLLAPARMPQAGALPPSLAALPAYQYLELRDQSWDRDVQALVERLAELGFRRRSPDPVVYPKPMINLREYTAEELAQLLRERPGWHHIESDMPGEPGKRRTELHRTYIFRSFEDAMAFMHAATPGISQRQHHPRWENIWRTVSVWLSTWDIGHKPSALDADLAAYLDALRKQFPPK